MDASGPQKRGVINHLQPTHAHPLTTTLDPIETFIPKSNHTTHMPLLVRTAHEGRTRTIATGRFGSDGAGLAVRVAELRLYTLRRCGSRWRAAANPAHRRFASLIDSLGSANQVLNARQINVTKFQHNKRIRYQPPLHSKKQTTYVKRPPR